MWHRHTDHGKPLHIVCDLHKGSTSREFYPEITILILTFLFPCSGSRMNNPERMTTLGSQGTKWRPTKQKIQHNMCWTPLGSNKDKSTIRHESSYKQREVNTNGTSFLCGNHYEHQNTEIRTEPNVVILSGLFILDCYIPFARTSIDNYFMVFLVYIKI
jgi:hypothetical protein